MPQAIVACSDEVETSHRSLGLRRDVVVIENGVDVAHPTQGERSEARSRFHIPPSAFVIGRAARWAPAKDFPALIDAAKLVVEEMPHVVFLLGGRGVDGANRGLTEQLAARGLENNFLLTGEQQGMAEFYAACDIVCSSSSVEGFPNTILEALASGVPVVATDVGGSSRILGDGGWLVPASDPQALSAALIEAASTPQEGLADRGERGRARVEREFSTRRMVSAYHELYRVLVRES
jgi:glycosyltransferase involved in cell wall biosynthesis